MLLVNSLEILKTIKMKIVFPLFAIFLMSDGGRCSQAQFMDNTRIVVEGKLKDSLNAPIQNNTVVFSNGINYLEAQTKSDGSFKFSTPITDVGCNITISNKSIIDLNSNNSEITFIYRQIFIPSKINYANLDINAK